MNRIFKALRVTRAGIEELVARGTRVVLAINRIVQGTIDRAASVLRANVNRARRGREGWETAIGVLVALVTIAAVLGGMIHATSALGVTAAQQTSVIVPTLPTTSQALLAADELAVRGTGIVDGAGRTVTLIGAADFSLEFSCAGDGHFQLSDFQAMRSWGMNTVRITLSSAFWRNLDGDCPDYTATVTAAVANAEAAGLYVILTLQWDAPFSLPQDATTGGAQCPMPDATYDVRFWQDIAEIYQDDPRVIFDLFSEPHDIDWTEWESGGTIASTCAYYSTPRAYQAIGMPELAAKVRAIAPSNLIILSGLGWGYDLSQIQPVNLQGILYGTHPWNHGNYQAPWDWPRAFGNMTQHLPVIAAEFGAYDCQTDYIATEIAYFQKLHMSFLAWAWTTGNCSDLIASWNGTPTTPYGQYIRQQMLQVAAGH
jgi:endoglucanase